jgi:hypothetical protein
MRVLMNRAGEASIGLRARKAMKKIFFDLPQRV